MGMEIKVAQAARLGIEEAMVQSKEVQG